MPPSPAPPAGRPSPARASWSSLLPIVRGLLETGTALLLLFLPLVFSTSLADAVMAPKQALFQLAAGMVVAAWAAGAAGGAWAWRPRGVLLATAAGMYLWWAACGLLTGLSVPAVPGVLDAALQAFVLIAWAATLTRGRAARWVAYPCLAALVAGLYSHLQRLTPLGLGLGPVRLVDPIGWNNPHLALERTIATFGNPDYLAAYLVAVLPLGLSWVLQRERHRTLGLVAWVVVALAMVLTLTRAAWVGAAVGAVVWVFVLVREQSPGKVLRGAAVAAVVLGVLLGAAVWRQAGHPGEFTVLRRLGSFTDFRDLSFRTRLFFWGAAGRTIAGSPFVGVGPGGFPAAARLHRDLEPVETRHPPRTPENPHNQYLTVAVESGVPGVLLLAATLVLFAQAALRRKGLAAAGLLGAGAAHWANQAFISSTLPTEVFWIFLIALAAAPEDPPEEEATASPLVLGAGGLLVVVLAMMSLRLLASERLLWLGEGEVLRGRAMLAARQYTGEDIFRVYQVALERYLQAAELAPAWTRSEAYRRLGDVYEELYVDLTGERGDPFWQAAVEAYRTAEAAEPDSPNVWISLGRVHGRRAESREEGLVATDRALRLDPRNPDYLGLRGQILLDLDRHEEAETAFRQALEIRPGLPRLLLGRAEALCALGRGDEAEAALETAVAADPAAAGAAERIRRSCAAAKGEELLPDR